jgi:hypothetical protein
VMSRKLRAALGAAPTIVSLVLCAPPAVADPPGCPVGATADGHGCSARLASVTADQINGTLTGTPIGGSVPITIFGEPAFYLPSRGFGSAAPDLVRQWDATIRGVSRADDPGSYSHGTAEALLPRQLNDLAAQFPAGTVVIRFTPDRSDPHILRPLSIQPTG